MPQLRNARILSLTAGATAAARMFLTSDVQYYPYFKIGIAVEYDDFKRHYQGRVPVLYNQVDVIANCSVFHLKYLI
jgi:hypothetical protein